MSPVSSPFSETLASEIQNAQYRWLMHWASLWALKFKLSSAGRFIDTQT
jgi:hypothetical protein